MTSPIFKIQSDYLNYILDGVKTSEGRVNDEKCQAISVGDRIVLQADNKKLDFIVVRRTNYGSVEEMLKQEGLENMLPNIKSLEEGILKYRSFGNFAEEEPIYGMVAFELKQC